MNWRRTTAGGLGLILLVLGSGYWWIGTRLITPVRRRVAPPPASLHAESVFIDSASGARLAGWLVVPSSPRAAVVVFHGIHASRTATLSRVELLRRAGYAVLAVDFQAHGESTGEAVTFGYRESQDAVSAVEYVRRRFPTLRVGAVGVSLGGAALALAGDRLHADAVVIESAYSTIEDATRNRIAMRLGPAARWLTPVLLLQLRPRIGVDAGALRPLDRIGTLRGPVLVLSGEADRYTTAAEAQALFAVAHGPKELWLVPGAVHEDLYHYNGVGYRRHVLSFLDRYLTRAAALQTQAGP